MLYTHIRAIIGQENKICKVICHCFLLQYVRTLIHMPIHMAIYNIRHTNVLRYMRANKTPKGVTDKCKETTELKRRQTMMMMLECI